MDMIKVCINTEYRIVINSTCNTHNGHDKVIFLWKYSWFLLNFWYKVQRTKVNMFNSVKWPIRNVGEWMYESLASVGFHLECKFYILCLGETVYLMDIQTGLNERLEVDVIIIIQRWVIITVKWRITRKLPLIWKPNLLDPRAWTYYYVKAVKQMQFFKFYIFLYKIYQESV